MLNARYLFIFQLSSFIFSNIDFWSARNETALGKFDVFPLSKLSAFNLSVSFNALIAFWHALSPAFDKYAAAEAAERLAREQREAEQAARALQSQAAAAAAAEAEAKANAVSLWKGQSVLGNNRAKSGIHRGWAESLYSTRMCITL